MGLKAQSTGLRAQGKKEQSRNPLLGGVGVGFWARGRRGERVRGREGDEKTGENNSVNPVVKDKYSINSIDTMNSNNHSRRTFARNIALAGMGAAGLGLVKCTGKSAVNKAETEFVRRYKFSLNAYSFNQPLRDGKMTVHDMLDFSAETGFDGVDLTGYYFPGYPAVPSDEYLYSVKKKAFHLGLYINGTGVRNDFTWSDPAKRAEEKKLVKEWVIVAEKLGAPSLRIFAGNLSKEDFTWDEKAKWIADDIRECAEFGRSHGVMMALQNHNDFIKNAEEVEKLLKIISHDWVGLMLDIGSYHVADPYAEIALNAKYAISWQLKEKVFVNDEQVDTDYEKIRDIVKECGYKAYLPIETLGEGDPVLKVRTLFNKVNSVLNT